MMIRPSGSFVAPVGPTAVYLTPLTCVDRSAAVRGNDQVVNESYVVTASGRAYTDVPPLTGVIFTQSGSSTMKVAVDVTRLSG
jgi:transglutaminase-like putative cysteine protease